MRKLALLIGLGGVLTLSAQEKITDRLVVNLPGQGMVTLHQDPRLEALLGSFYNPAIHEQKLQTTGYRILLYAGSNTRASKEEAYKAADYIRKTYPDLAVYTDFISPRWICRVGDYKTIEEADVMMRQLKKSRKFKDILILPNQMINISL